MRRGLRGLSVLTVMTATLLAFASPANAALTVRAHWNMNELPTMVDSAGGDNNGTTQNVTLSGGAYRFDGRSSSASAGDKPNLDPGTATVRVSARISFTTVPRTGQTFDIVRKGTTVTAGGSYKIEIKRSSSGQAIATCVFKDSTGRAGSAYGSANLAGRGFVTITCTKNSTGITVSAAGATRTVAHKIGSISNGAAVSIGSKGDGTDSFPGLMDWVKIEIG